MIISTWPFGKPSNDRALEVFKTGGSALDAVEKGINLAEDDLKNASVGAGGIPNAAGVVQLDACIMDGPTHKAGSVAALEGIAHAVSVARRVMEKTRHVMLVGAGAKAFAIAGRFPRAGFADCRTETEMGGVEAKAAAGEKSRHDRAAGAGTGWNDRGWLFDQRIELQIARACGRLAHYWKRAVCGQ